MCQAVASWPSEQPTVSIFIPARACQPVGTIGRSRQALAGADPDQADVVGEVEIDDLPSDRRGERDLVRPVLAELAVEEIDRDLPRRLLGRERMRVIELEEVPRRSGSAIPRGCSG